MDKELKKYLIEQCRAWMLEEEIRALRRIGLTESGEETTRRIALIDFKMELSYGFKDPKTNELAALEEDELEIRIATRLLRDHENEIINNCPKCGQLTRTPKAKQCRYCHLDWH